MSRRVISYAKLAFANLCALALAQSLALAQDPVKVASSQYKMISENDRVRILDVNLLAGAKTPTHSHPDLLGVVLEPSTIKWTSPDGKSTQSPADMKRGGVVFQAGSTHVSENTGKTAAHVVVVEFKKSAPSAATARKPSLPSPYKQVNDNPHALVFEGTAAAGATIPQHTHGDHIIIALTDGTGEVTNADGKKQTLAFKKDSATWSGPVTHSAVNTGKTPLHLIVVELK